MIALRLSRKGKKNRPTWRIIVQEKQRSPFSKAIEIVGSVNPHRDPPEAVFKKDRIEYWISKGAQPSATVHNLLVAHHLINAPKQRVVSLKKKSAGQTKDQKSEKK